MVSLIPILSNLTPLHRLTSRPTPTGTGQPTPPLVCPLVAAAATTSSSIQILASSRVFCRSSSIVADACVCSTAPIVDC
ncbi:hypothetical protein COLO4_35778 [Corchorus olitorius]|uniref:Uncharacterized protein n=1 Tax=Corchorus olitorius TaxID=93759 RepID=A0A1R3GDE0_9ROSI|nr:hypothetical protein COLO4_35778 [Corchorus olitorius]